MEEQGLGVLLRLFKSAQFFFQRRRLSVFKRGFAVNSISKQ
jgi:hypothetical protein